MQETLYWPGMNKELTEFISKCQVCSAEDQAKEPLISHKIPARPWEKIGCDMFELDGKDYLITVDYYSSFFEVERLRNKTGKEVIGKLKQHLARHGLPNEFVSDNGPTLKLAVFLHRLMTLNTSQAPLVSHNPMGKYKIQ